LEELYESRKKKGEGVTEIRRLRGFSREEGRKGDAMTPLAPKS